MNKKSKILYYKSTNIQNILAYYYSQVQLLLRLMDEIHCDQFLLQWNQTAVEIRGKKLRNIEIEHEVHGKVAKETFSYLIGHKPGTRELSRLLKKKETIYQKIALSRLNFKLSPGAVRLFDLLANNRIQ